MGLILTPEVVYVKDIYGGDNKRFNTMFKLTYQAFVLFAIIFGITVAIMLYRLFTGMAAASVTAVCLGISAVYILLSAAYSAHI